MRLYEECANCTKKMVFCSEESRQLAMDEYVGEILCVHCKVEVADDD